MKSVHALFLIAFIWVLLGTVYYPKWNKSYSEAAISWDVSGYYHYLPAIFIYHDIRQQTWVNEINQKYLPSPAYDQAFGHVNSGNKVNKYAIGQALLYSPFFLVAHAYTKVTNSFPADGYSKPYQVSIWLGSLLFSLLGLVFLRRILIDYFDDAIVCWTLLALGLGTHWLEYASITNGLNHTWLFTLLCGLILCSIRFYKRTDWTSAIGIGVFLGLAVLTRPTELIWVFIPLLWGITSLKDRFSFLLTNWKKCFVAAIIAGLIISIQMIYWKYVAGEWLVYSYGDQKFNWLHPKIWRGLMGTNIGWWLYTPMMLIMMFGWRSLYKNHKPVFWPVFVTGLLAVYVTLSWPYWETGGGLGQRNLIQAYPLFAFPLACVIAWFWKSVSRKWIWVALLLANIYYTGWWIDQAHRGGFFQPGQMSTPYFFRVVGRLHPDRDYFKLLDTKEYYDGDPVNPVIVFEECFEEDSLACSITLADSSRVACLNGEVQFIGPLTLPLDNECNDWIRLEGDFTVQTREWDVWKYAQWLIVFYKDDVVVKTNLIRLQRMLPKDGVPAHLFFDIRIPEEEFDKCAMSFWNAASSNTILVDNLKASCFRD